MFFNNKTTISVSESVAQKFRHWLLSDRSLEPVTVRERIVMMNACWEWGQKKKLVTENPWEEVKVSVAPKQCPQPFTLAEIGSIVHTFRSDSNRASLCRLCGIQVRCWTPHRGSRSAAVATLLLQLRSNLDRRKFK